MAEGMSEKLSEKHLCLIRAISEYMEMIKFPKSNVATYRIVVLKGKKKGEYAYVGEQLIEGHHELPYEKIIKHKDLIN